MLLALATGLALASDWYLETADRADKGEATSLSQAASGRGHEARVVRRFVDGAGWRYLVRVEGFDDRAEAEGAARDLAASLAVGVAVFEVDGTVARLVAEVASAAPAREAAPAAPADAAPLLEAAIAAHGVTPGTLAAVRTGPVRLEYRRRLPDGRVLDHVWAARDGALYAEVRPVEGTARASRTLVTADGAWLSVDGGPWTPQNPDKTRATLEQLGPAGVVPVVLALAAAVESRREFERMVPAGSGDADGVATEILRFAGDAISDPIELEVGRGDHLLRRVRFDGGVVHELSGYRKGGPPGVPATVSTLRDGKVADTVEITLLDLKPTLPDAWFAAPR